MRNRRVYPTYPPSVPNPDGRGHRQCDARGPSSVREGKRTKAEPESVEKFITDLRTEEVEGRNGSPSFDFVKQSLMSKTASPRDVVTLAKVLEKMVSSGGGVVILDDIINLPNGPEAEKISSSPTDQPRNHWLTPTLAVMPLSRSRFQRSIIVDYQHALVKGF